VIRKKGGKRSSDGAFEAEARRQCLKINALVQDPNSDEAAVMRELDAAFDEMCREIEAEEARNRCAI